MILNLLNFFSINNNPLTMENVSISDLGTGFKSTYTFELGYTSPVFMFKDQPIFISNKIRSSLKIENWDEGSKVEAILRNKESIENVFNVNSDSCEHYKSEYMRFMENDFSVFCARKKSYTPVGQTSYFELVELDADDKAYISNLIKPMFKQQLTKLDSIINNYISNLTGVAFDDATPTLNFNLEKVQLTCAKTITTIDNQPIPSCTTEIEIDASHGLCENHEVVDPYIADLLFGNETSFSEINKHGSGIITVETNIDENHIQQLFKIMQDYKVTGKYQLYSKSHNYWSLYIFDQGVCKSAQINDLSVMFDNCDTVYGALPVAYMADVHCEAYILYLAYAFAYTNFQDRNYSIEYTCNQSAKIYCGEKQYSLSWSPKTSTIKVALNKKLVCRQLSIETNLISSEFEAIASLLN